MMKQCRRRRNREGLLLIAVLVCIAIALALAMAALQTSLYQRRHLSRTLQLEQTRLLLDAAANSKAFQEWSKSQQDADEVKTLKISLQMPTGKPAVVTAAEADDKTFLLTAMIGDAENKLSVTRRSRSVGKDDK